MNQADLARIAYKTRMAPLGQPLPRPCPCRRRVTAEITDRRQGARVLNQVAKSHTRPSASAWKRSPSNGCNRPKVDTHSTSRVEADCRAMPAFVPAFANGRFNSVAGPFTAWLQSYFARSLNIRPESRILAHVKCCVPRNFDWGLISVHDCAIALTLSKNLTPFANGPTS